MIILLLSHSRFLTCCCCLLYISVCVFTFFLPYFHSFIPFLPFHHRHRIILLLCRGWFLLSFHLLIRIDVENMDFKHVSIAEASAQFLQSFLYQMYVYKHKVYCESEQNLFHSKSTSSHALVHLFLPFWPPIRCISLVCFTVFFPHCTLFHFHIVVIPAGIN